MLSPQRYVIWGDIHAFENKNILPLKRYWLFFWLIERDVYFRKLFYYRLGCISKLCSWYSQGSKILELHGSISEGAIFMHAYSTIINAKKVGSNFTCRQCTTVGNKIDGRNDLIPIIGDNVTLGANVVIIGDIKIGNNVIVGAGSVVVNNVPDNCVVAGNPSKIIKIIK